MAQNQVLFLGIAWVLAGVFFAWNVRRTLSRHVMLCSSVVAQMILWAAVGFVIILPGSIGVKLFQGHVSPDYILDTTVSLMSLGLLAVAVICVSARLLPDTWIVQSISEEGINIAIDKALAQAELDPERTLTGLRFDQRVVLRLYYWRTANLCLLEWHPRNGAARFPKFQVRLEEVLCTLPSSPRYLVAAGYALIATAAIGFGSILALGAFF